MASLLTLALSFRDLERTSTFLHKLSDHLKIKENIARKITEREMQVAVLFLCLCLYFLQIWKFGFQ